MGTEWQIPGDEVKKTWTKDLAKLITIIGCHSYPFKRQPHKMVKHAQTIRRLLLRTCLSVFDHFVGLALKGL